MPWIILVSGKYFSFLLDGGLIGDKSILKSLVLGGCIFQDLSGMPIGVAAAM